MTVSAILLGLSLGLLLYWFRYSCRLILNARPARDYAQHSATANELEFLVVQRDLKNARMRGEFDLFEQKLKRDYHLLSFLLGHSPALQAEAGQLEQRLLMLDFKLLEAYYAVARSVSGSLARRALQEMAQVVGYFANAMGQRAGCLAE